MVKFRNQSIYYRSWFSINIVTHVTLESETEEDMNKRTSASVYIIIQEMFIKLNSNPVSRPKDCPKTKKFIKKSLR